MEALFGYKRMQMLDNNINILMPYVIGSHHDAFVEDYFAKGKLNWQDRIKK